MALFVLIMLLAGVRFVPRLLGLVDATGSRELFILAVLSAALGISFAAAELFDVSLALGAFLAGIVVNASPLSHRAGEEALPLREAFSVLFFVSVGMLIDPLGIAQRAVQVAGVVFVVIVAKSAIAFAVVRLLRGSAVVGLTVAAGLAQIGEFSFLLAETAYSLGILPDEGRDLVLAAALVSIGLNPGVSLIARRLAARLSPVGATVSNERHNLSKA
jgi:CPA2 family monovalent cation:H+ antiporter-2